MCEGMGAVDKNFEQERERLGNQSIILIQSNSRV